MIENAAVHLFIPPIPHIYIMRFFELLWLFVLWTRCVRVAMIFAPRRHEVDRGQWAPCSSRLAVWFRGLRGEVYNHSPPCSQLSSAGLSPPSTSLSVRRCPPNLILCQ
ncbi:hypothetical protein PENSPDRAFT_81037 [Peniophora sp. CONT]|nr:hypothetical protein PENSPDRAFT_81037 [Peniophora sp. CONT]